MGNKYLSVNGDYVRQRITELREQKGLSEYRMSKDLGQSKGYIQNIVKGRALPSLAVLFDICEYFGITVQDFWAEAKSTRTESSQATLDITGLGEDEVKAILNLAEMLKSKKSDE